MNGKFIALLTLMAICVNECSSSAIPVWEFLRRDEKVSKQLRSAKLKAILCFIKQKSEGKSSKNVNERHKQCGRRKVETFIKLH